MEFYGYCIGENENLRVLSELETGNSWFRVESLSFTVQLWSCLIPRSEGQRKWRLHFQLEQVTVILSCIINPFGDIVLCCLFCSLMRHEREIFFLFLSLNAGLNNYSCYWRLELIRKKDSAGGMFYLSKQYNQMCTGTGIKLSPPDFHFYHLSILQSLYLVYAGWSGCVLRIFHTYAPKWVCGLDLLKVAFIKSLSHSITNMPNLH